MTMKQMTMKHVTHNNYRDIYANNEKRLAFLASTDLCHVPCKMLLAYWHK